MGKMAAGCPHCHTGGRCEKGGVIVSLVWSPLFLEWHCVVCGYVGDGKTEPARPWLRVRPTERKTERLLRAV